MTQKKSRTQGKTGNVQRELRGQKGSKKKDFIRSWEERARRAVVGFGLRKRSRSGKRCRQGRITAPISTYKFGCKTKVHIFFGNTWDLAKDSGESGVDLQILYL